MKIVFVIFVFNLIPVWPHVLVPSSEPQPDIIILQINILGEKNKFWQKKIILERKNVLQGVDIAEFKFESN